MACRTFIIFNLCKLENNSELYFNTNKTDIFQYCTCNLKDLHISFEGTGCTCGGCSMLCGKGRISSTAPTGLPEPLMFILSMDSTRNKHHIGCFIYHHNRLIKMYVCVGIQFVSNSRGVGVIGVVDTSFLSTHNKQDFVQNNFQSQTAHQHAKG